MAVLAKVGTLHEHLPSVLVDPCLYYCCTTHQALAALRSLCTEGCARTVPSTCVGVRNVIREFIWTAATLLCAHIRTGFFDAYCMYVHYMYVCTCGMYARYVHTLYQAFMYMYIQQNRGYTTHCIFFAHVHKHVPA